MVSKGRSATLSCLCALWWKSGCTPAVEASSAVPPFSPSFASAPPPPLALAPPPRSVSTLTHVASSSSSKPRAASMSESESADVMAGTAPARPMCAPWERLV